MNLQHLKYVIEVEKTGSISKAAENLFMNQPNLSKVIKELESAMGIIIFNRTPKGVLITREGHVFLEYAKSILSQYDNMCSHFSASPQAGFRVSVPRASYIAEAFAQFIKDVDLANEFYTCFRETDAMVAIQNVLEDNYNLGIIRYRTMFERYFVSFLKERELDCQELLVSDSYIIMSQESLLAEKAILEPSDLDGFIEISNDDFAMPRNYMLGRGGAGPEENKKRILVYERGSQFDLLSQVPKTYMWVAPMPSDVLGRNRLVQKRCEVEGMGFKDVLISRRGHTFTSTERLFLEKLELVKSTILFA